MKPLLKNRYLLLKKLSNGSHGVTYIAEDTKTKDKVVVKRLRHELSKETRKSWPREVTMLQSLEHPQIC